MYVRIFTYILHTHTDEREVAGHQCAAACEALGGGPVPADSSSGTPPACSRVAIEHATIYVSPYSILLYMCPHCYVSSLIRVFYATTFCTMCPHCYYLPQAHEQLARVALETALSLPTNTQEADQACSIARALAKKKNALLSLSSSCCYLSI